VKGRDTLHLCARLDEWLSGVIGQHLGGARPSCRACAAALAAAGAGSPSRVPHAPAPPQGNKDGPVYSSYLTEANAERLAAALCRMRGAALKLGQLLSIQDENVMPPQVGGRGARVLASALAAACCWGLPPCVRAWPGCVCP